MIDVVSVDRDWSALVDRLSQAASNARSVERASALWLEVSRVQSNKLGETSAAIRTLQRVLKVDPRHLTALERLSRLFQSSQSWHEAVATMEQLLSAAPSSDRMQRIELELASLYRTQLDLPDKALRHVESVLATEPTDAEALLELSLTREQMGQLDEALSVARRLLETTELEWDRAKALVRVANLGRVLGNVDDARRALEQAVALSGPASEAAEQLRDLSESTSHWKGYVLALESYQQTEGADRETTVLEMARVLSECCQDEEAAIKALSATIDGGLSSADLRRELAVRLRGRGLIPQAVAQLQHVLGADPLRQQEWQELARTYEAGGRPREARIAAAALCALGLDDQDDRNLMAASPPKPACVRPNSLRGSVLDQLGSPRLEDAAAGALLSALSPVLAKLYPPELESYGLGTRDRLATETNHPLREIANRIALGLGVGDFDLFLHRVRNRGVSIEFGVHPALMVPATIMEKSASAQTFLLAQPLVHIARGYTAIEKLTPRELDVLLASAARMVKPEFGVGLTSEEFLNEQARIIQRAIPRRDRRAIRDAAAAYAEARRVKFDRWVSAAHRTAGRVALLLCDDLEPMIQQLRSRVGPEGSTESVALEAHPGYRDAFSFWASAPAMHLRQYMGMVEAG